MIEINERFLEEAKEQKRRAECFPELVDALKTLLDAVNGNRVTHGDCNQAAHAIKNAEQA